MTPAEVVLWVEGFEHRYDLLSQMLAHFVSYLGSVSGNWGRGKKTPKARDLWRSRAKVKPKAAKVIELEEHRRLAREFKESGPPPILRRRG